METAATQTTSLIAHLSYARTTSRFVAVTADGASAGATAVNRDSVEISIQIDATFVGRVLQESLEERLNTALQSAGINASATELMQSGTDYSPEATATRIIEFATSFHAQYRASVNEGEEPGSLESFMELIGDAVKEGFADARSILEGFEEMDEGLLANVERTLELTLEGLEAFAASQRSAAENADLDPTLPI